MSDNIVKFPVVSNTRPTEKSGSEASSNRYAFLNINFFDGAALDNLLCEEKFSLVIDLRPFPTFDYPHFSHKHVLANFKVKDIFYFPAAYLKCVRELHSSLSAHRKIIVSRAHNGGILFITDDETSKSKSTRRWSKFMEQKVSGSMELHPSIFAQYRRTPRKVRGL